MRTAFLDDATAMDRFEPTWFSELASAVGLEPERRNRPPRPRSVSPANDD
jgi:hypothetical protein